MVAAPLRGVSKDGPGNHASGAAPKPAPTKSSAITANPEEENMRLVFIPYRVEYSHRRTRCTQIALGSAIDVKIGPLAALSNAAHFLPVVQLSIREQVS